MVTRRTIIAHAAASYAAADRLLARAAQVAGGDGLRCLVSYRVIGGLAVYTHERQAYGNSLGGEECAAETAILDRLQATGRAWTFS